MSQEVNSLTSKGKWTHLWFPEPLW